VIELATIAWQVWLSITCDAPIPSSKSWGNGFVDFLGRLLFWGVDFSVVFSGQFGRLLLHRGTILEQPSVRPMSMELGESNSQRLLIPPSLEEACATSEEA
jgi:hypothetical protein